VLKPNPVGGRLDISPHNYENSAQPVSHAGSEFNLALACSVGRRLLHPIALRSLDYCNFGNVIPGFAR